MSVFTSILLQQIEPSRNQFKSKMDKDQTKGGKSSMRSEDREKDRKTDRRQTQKNNQGANQAPWRHTDPLGHLLLCLYVSLSVFLCGWLLLPWSISSIARLVLEGALKPSGKTEVEVVELGMRAGIVELHYSLQQNRTCVLQLSRDNAAYENFCLDTYQAFKSRLVIDWGWFCYFCPLLFFLCPCMYLCMLHIATFS